MSDYSVKQLQRKIAEAKRLQAHLNAHIRNLEQLLKQVQRLGDGRGVQVK